MKLLIITLLSALATLCPAKILTDEFIRSINAKQTTWTASRNFPEDTPIEVLKGLVGTFPPNTTNVPRKFHRVSAAAIPDSFDSRDVWPQCESIREIRSQGSCGACWAFATTEAMTDRICVASNGAQKFHFSAEDMLTCCSDCGDCKGGQIEKAWNFYVQHGVVSGGDYNSNDGCQPYDGVAYNNGNTPGCATYCTNQNYGTEYNQDKHYGSNYYWVGNNVQQMQTEIMNHGPLEVYMDVFQDFYNYNSGVYTLTTGDNVGGHAVKFIGWGTENGVPYWLAANSWGTGFGSMGGFFKIIRGQNNCRVEEWPYAGEPRL